MLLCAVLAGNPAPVAAPAPAAQESSAAIPQPQSLTFKLEQMAQATAAPGPTLTPPPLAPAPAAGPMIIDMTSDGPDSKQQAAPAAEPVPTKPTEAAAAAGKRSRQQASAGARGSNPDAIQAGAQAQLQQGPAKRARPVYNDQQDSFADDEDSDNFSWKEAGGDTSSSEYDAADALFKMAHSKPKRGRKNKAGSDARASGASSKLKVTPGLVLAGDRAAAAAAGVMPGYLTEQLVRTEPAAAAAASPVPISFVQSPATAGRSLGKVRTAGSPTATAPDSTAANADSWFMTCTEEVRCVRHARHAIPVGCLLDKLVAVPLAASWTSSMTNTLRCATSRRRMPSRPNRRGIALAT
jgi:hypothetical protein